MFFISAKEVLELMGDDVKGGKYFAIIALDGDSIGKWVSGEMAPFYKSLFANYPDANDKQRQGPVEAKWEVWE